MTTEDHLDDAARTLRRSLEELVAFFDADPLGAPEALRALEDTRSHRSARIRSDAGSRPAAPLYCKYCGTRLMNHPLDRRCGVPH